MSITIDKEAAKRVLLEEAAAERRAVGVPVYWEQAIRELSEACEEAGIRTHIAFLGTALLARATDLRADTYAVKAKAKTAGAYSARSLGHGVLVPNAIPLGIHLGVTGREPLNNQPYFRVERATEATLRPLVLGSAIRPVELLVAILATLEATTTRDETRAALRAFIRVRRSYQPAYPTAPVEPPAMTPARLLALVERLVSDSSEGGRRAQAVAAGVMDAVSAAPRLVEVGRINDPDRHLAGDVGVLASAEERQWERVFEVRDKPVSKADLHLFAHKLAESGVKRGAVLAISEAQESLDANGAVARAAENGVYLVVFCGWREFIPQALFWCAVDPVEASILAHQQVRQRLIDVEASAEAVELWDRG